MESSQEQNQLHQELPREKQEELTDEELRRRAEAFEEFQKSPNSHRLRRFAEILDYDDGCGGEAVRAYREQFREAAAWLESLRASGFTDRLRGGTPEKDGSLLLEVMRNENPDQKLTLYYEKFGAFPGGFSQQHHEKVMEQIRDRAQTAIGVARMFRVKVEKPPSA